MTGVRVQASVHSGKAVLYFRNTMKKQVVVKYGVVGQELESLPGFHIEVADSAQGIGIGFRGFDRCQNDGVIRSHACSFVHRVGVAPLSLVRTTKNASRE